MAVTLKDVAEKAGVSRSAVSRTFTDGASVSAKTRAKVEAAAEGLGYTPNALASSLTTGRTKLIGLIANNFRNPLILEVFDLFTRGLQDRGLRPLLVNLSQAGDPEASVRMLRQYSVDGVIIASSTLPPSFALAFRAAKLPVVHAFGRTSAVPEVHVVGIDNVACGRMAAETLIQCGYRRLGFLGGPENATSTQDRAAGFLQGLAGRQASISFAGDYTFDAGRAEMQRLLQTAPAEAYFCGDDLLAVGALSAITDAGLSVPGDIGLIGLNDMEMSRWQNIGLTTIRQPVAAIIEAAIELVVASDRRRRDMAPQSPAFPLRGDRAGDSAAVRLSGTSAGGRPPIGAPAPWPRPLPHVNRRHRPQAPSGARGQTGRGSVAPDRIGQVAIDIGHGQRKAFGMGNRHAAQAALRPRKALPSPFSMIWVRPPRPAYRSTGWAVPRPSGSRPVSPKTWMSNPCCRPMATEEVQSRPTVPLCHTEVDHGVILQNWRAGDGRGEVGRKRGPLRSLQMKLAICSA